jgi:hypothetical protein
MFTIHLEMAVRGVHFSYPFQQLCSLVSALEYEYYDGPLEDHDDD